jgi:hypothetical protein
MRSLLSAFVGCALSAAALEQIAVTAPSAFSAFAGNYTMTFPVGKGPDGRCAYSSTDGKMSLYFSQGPYFVLSSVSVQFCLV